MADLEYNGTALRWAGTGSFRATSGMQGFQKPSDQCLREKGPVPEGNYTVRLIEGGFAEDDGRNICNLKASWRIEAIPRGDAAGDCEQYWANWGNNRVRFEAADELTKAKCSPSRGGFTCMTRPKDSVTAALRLKGHSFTHCELSLHAPPAGR